MMGLSHAIFGLASWNYSNHTGSDSGHTFCYMLPVRLASISCESLYGPNHGHSAVLSLACE